MIRRWMPVAITVGCLTAAFGLTGCSEKKEEPKIVKITDGRITRITPKDDGTGEISVAYKTEKSDTEVDGKATVVATTEIIINGVPAKLAELAVGERVSGEVRVEKTGKVTQLVAVKIHVERAKPAETPAAPPAGTPAGG